MPAPPKPRTNRAKAEEKERTLALAAQRTAHKTIIDRIVRSDIRLQRPTRDEALRMASALRDEMVMLYRDVRKGTRSAKEAAALTALLSEIIEVVNEEAANAGSTGSVIYWRKLVDEWLAFRKSGNLAVQQ